MATQEKKTASSTTAKSDMAVKKESVQKKKDEATPPGKIEPGANATKPEAGVKAAEKSAAYSRGEGQKPVTQAYKDNWDEIYGKRKKKRK